MEKKVDVKKSITVATAEAVKDIIPSQHKNRPVKKRTYNRMKRRDEIDGTIMASIPFAGYILFSLFPMVLSLVVSFTELHSYQLDSMKWVGLQNYTEIFRSKMLYTALKNSLFYCLSVPINMIASLFIANLLTKKVKGIEFSRTLLFLPTICSSVGVTLMWSWIYEPNFGIINTVLDMIGLSKIGFTTTKEWFMPSIIFMSLWRSGTNIVLMQSALANVNESLKEAARVEGATERQVFWKITFPGVTPTLFYQLVMNFLAAMQEMAIMQILATNGVGPGHAAVTLAYYQYRMAFVDVMADGMGKGCALGWIIAIVIMIVTRVQFKISEKWVNYD